MYKKFLLSIILGCVVLIFENVLNDETKVGNSVENNLTNNIEYCINDEAEKNNILEIEVMAELEDLKQENDTIINSQKGEIKTQKNDTKPTTNEKTKIEINYDENKKDTQDVEIKTNENKTENTIVKNDEEIKENINVITNNNNQIKTENNNTSSKKEETKEVYTYNQNSTESNYMLSEFNRLTNNNSNFSAEVKDLAKNGYYFYPYRESEIKKQIKNITFGDFYVYAEDVFVNGVYKRTVYYINFK